jgi:hypothetical protein
MFLGWRGCLVIGRFLTSREEVSERSLVGHEQIGLATVQEVESEAVTERRLGSVVEFNGKAVRPMPGYPEQCNPSHGYARAPFYVLPLILSTTDTLPGARQELGGFCGAGFGPGLLPSVT